MIVDDFVQYSMMIHINARMGSIHVPYPDNVLGKGIL